MTNVSNLGFSSSGTFTDFRFRFRISEAKLRRRGREPEDGLVLLEDRRIHFDVGVDDGDDELAHVDLDDVNVDVDRKQEGSELDVDVAGVVVGHHHRVEEVEW